MTAPHTFIVNRSELDFGLTVTSGQVFRWESIDGGWRGVDGDRWAVVEVRESEYIFVSSHALGDWEPFWGARAPESPPAIADQPFFREYLAAVRGLRLLAPRCPVETLFSFLCTPNNHLKRIGPMVRALASFGEPLPDPRFMRFPTLERIAEVAENELRSKGFGYRAATIPRVAAAILQRGGTEWLEQLKSEDLRSVRRQLIDIPSIGPKLADCIALYALHHRRAAPIDTHLWSAVTEHLFPDWRGQALTAKKGEAVQDFFESEFGEAAGWVQLVMYFGHMRTQRGRLEA